MLTEGCILRYSIKGKTGNNSLNRFIMEGTSRREHEQSTVIDNVIMKFIIFQTEKLINQSFKGLTLGRTERI